MEERIDDCIMLTLDQREFFELCSNFVKECLHGKTMEVTMGKQKSRGYKYSDFVVTITSNRLKNSFEVVRNRDGMLVLAVYDGKPRSIHWSFIYVQKYIQSLMDTLTDKSKGSLPKV